MNLAINKYCDFKYISSIKYSKIFKVDNAGNETFVVAPMQINLYQLLSINYSIIYASIVLLFLCYWKENRAFHYKSYERAVFFVTCSVCNVLVSLLTISKLRSTCKKVKTWPWEEAKPTALTKEEKARSLPSTWYKFEFRLTAVVVLTRKSQEKIETETWDCFKRSCTTRLDSRTRNRFARPYLRYQLFVTFKWVVFRPPREI